MKKYLLLLCLLPTFIFAQSEFKSKKDSRTFLRSAASISSVYLDSAYVYSLPDELGTLLGTQRFVYDDIGRVTTKFEERDWNGDGVTNFMKEEYEYTTEDSSLKQKVSYSYLTAIGWTLREYEVYTYNENEVVMSMVYYDTHWLTGILGKELSIVADEAKLDSWGNPTEYILYNMNDEIESILSVNYDNKNLLQSSIQSELEGKVWIEKWKTSFIYDDEGYLIREESYEKENSSQDNEWQLEEVIYYTYDDRGNLISEISKNDYDVTIYSKYYKNFYSEVATNNSFTMPADGIRIYPTVVTDYVRIELPETTRAKVSMYNVTGKLYKNDVLGNQSSTLSVSNVPKGIYIIRVETHQQVKTQKIVVK